MNALLDLLLQNRKIDWLEAIYEETRLQDIDRLSQKVKYKC